jgi:lipopolysaccharide export system permease protein
MLPGPFVAWLGALMVLLLLQFLIKYLPDIIGKGLPAGVLIELVAYNLAYMLVLAVPMSVLIAALLTFGRLAESNAYSALKSAGVSLLQVAWPALLVGVTLTAGMIHFNNVVLPEANFRARNLWQDIRRAKPGFELQPGVFYNGLNQYSILVQSVDPDTDVMTDVLIYDYSEGSGRQAVVKATTGRIESSPDGHTFDIVLKDGEVHRLRSQFTQSGGERYERIAFSRYRLGLDMSSFGFERSEASDNFRSDRTMRTSEMVVRLDTLRSRERHSRAMLRDRVRPLMTDAGRPVDPPGERVLDRDTLGQDAFSISYDEIAHEDEPGSGQVQEAREEGLEGAARSRYPVAGLDADMQQAIISLAVQNARSVRSQIESTSRAMGFDHTRATRYEIEIHKKYSIAFACLIFMLLGIPLGLTLRQGGLGRMGALTVAIFVFYWAALMQGEKLADRFVISPVAGMWGANVVMLIAAVALILNETHGLPLFRPRRSAS